MNLIKSIHLILLLVVMLTACNTQHIGDAPVGAAVAAETATLPIVVENVQILTGFASPIPALISISGTWPGLCTQLAEVSQTLQGNVIDVTLTAHADGPDCPPDHFGVPFALELPVNWNELPEGAYTVRVNDQHETALYVPVVPPATDGDPVLGNPVVPEGDVADGRLPQGDGAAPQPVNIRSLQIEVGFGSPIPVYAVVDADWPSLCAQIASIEQQLQPFAFDISVLADPGPSDCPPDYVGYGFALRIPINAVELAEGSYTVTVNGTSATFEVPLTPIAAD